VVLFDQATEQDQDGIQTLAAGLSRELRCPVLAMLNHDDDILWYQLHVDGRLSDHYDSSPGYFDAAAEPAAPAGSDAQKCDAFNTGTMTAIADILRKSSYDDDGYVFAFERHHDLVRELGLPACAVGTAYESLERGEYPDGLSPQDVMKTS
jgi:hypothetical protein